MENKTRFDLNQQLARWRNSLLAREAMDADRVRELESHLREALAELHTKGLSEEEAFRAGTQRLGEANALAVQFELGDKETKMASVPRFSTTFAPSMRPFS